MDPSWRSACARELGAKAMPPLWQYLSALGQPLEPICAPKAK
jgi:hypothetical protein